MDIQRDALTIKVKADATPALLSQLKSDDRKDGCAGTFHTVGDYVLPCTGDGMVIRRFEQTSYTCTGIEHRETIGILKSLIEKNNLPDLFDSRSNNVETIVCRPLSVSVCPCKSAARLDDYQKGILTALGIGVMPTLSPIQSQAVEAFKRSKKSLYISGENLAGKTTLAAACALTYQRGVKVLKGDDIATELRNMALNNKNPTYSGLLILDDIARVKPTEAMREKLFLIFDAARAGSFRLVVTCKDSKAELCRILSLGDEKAEKDLKVRIAALTDVFL